MNKIGWYDTYCHFYCYNEWKIPMIYQDKLNGGRERGWSDAYIQFNHPHQHFIHIFEMKSGLSLETYFHIFHHRPYYHLLNFHKEYHQNDKNKQIYATIYHGHLGYGSNSGWSGAYIHLYNHPQQFFHIARGRVAGIFIPRYKSTIINTSTTTLVTIITTYIPPPVTIIATDNTPLDTMNTIS